MGVMILGGAGFVGNALARALSKLDQVVYVADTLDVKPERSLPESVYFEKTTVKSRKKLWAFIDLYKPDIIFHLVARQGYRRDFANFGKTNVAPIYNLFDALNRVYETKHWKPRKLILGSSQAVYEPGLLRCEGDSLVPYSVYGLSKLQQESAFLCLAKALDYNALSLRYSIILGYGQSLQSGESGIMRNWLRAFRKKENPQIYGNGEQIRDFVHISDVTTANLNAMESGGGVVNVAGFPRSVLQMFLAFQKATGCKDAEILERNVRPGGEYSLTSCGNLAKTKIQYEPRVQPEDQIKDFIDKYVKKVEDGKEETSDPG